MTFTTRLEIAAIFGLSVTPETITTSEDGTTVTTPEVDSTVGYSFYTTPVATIETGISPIEFAGMNVTENCRAVVQNGILYVATLGTAIKDSALTSPQSK